MSVEVVNPFDSYRADSGVPLDAGKLYVGVANLDPITNPIAVFYDEALTIAAPQPLVTSGGYVWRSGAPARIYVAERQFSMRLLTSNGQQVFYEPVYQGVEGRILDAVDALNTDLTARYIAADVVLDDKILVQAQRITGETVARTSADAIEQEARTAQDTVLLNLINALANGATKAYLTYAALDAAKATLPANSFARVTNDPTPANNWLWQWNGTVLTKSDRDDLAVALAAVAQEVADRSALIGIDYTQDGQIALKNALGFVFGFLGVDMSVLNGVTLTGGNVTAKSALVDRYELNNGCTLYPANSFFEITTGLGFIID